MRIFWEKFVIIVSARTPVCLRRLWAPPPDPRVVIPACYYNSIEFLSISKCILFRSKKNQVTTANVLPLFLSHFCTYFLIQTVSFDEGGRKNIYCPRAQGILATLLPPIHCEFKLSTSNCIKGPFFDFKISPYSFYNALASFQLTLTNNKSCYR